MTELCDKKVSEIGLGTWKMGGGFWTADYSNDDKYIEAISYAISKGINVIDTAEMYGGGHTEELVGKAVLRFQRDDVFIITKVWNNHLKYDDVIKSATNSLKRLNTKYIDLYLIHWPNPSVKLSETLAAMEELVDKGIVRCIGVSNFDLNLLKEAITLTRKYEIVADEIEYSIYDLSPERDIIPFAKKNGIKIIAYSPLGQGRIATETILSDIAQKYGKTVAQIALAYLKKNAIPIPKSANKKHIDEIAEVLRFDLSDEDAKEVRRRMFA
ncbi:aldo/keto reductase [Stygiolobus sp. CP850M]|uniref:aldo/keto reductase n=1 Tax=Stygiolobus sp. CP850M TaxID=3133134 RepID=UPI00307DFCC0